MTLTLTAQVDARDVDLELQVDAGDRLAVLGPNGAGKSTLLALLAGTLRPDHGRAVLDGEVLSTSTDATAGGSRRTPAASRCWPRTRCCSRTSACSTTSPSAPGPLGCPGPRPTRPPGDGCGRWTPSRSAIADPAQLSGGQAQRIAVARAVAADPRLLLLDEPLAALDVTVAPLLRRVLRDVLAERSVIVVTHDLLDAVMLSNRVVVLDGGRVVESGATAEVLRHPTSAFAARLAGLNLVAGVAHAEGLQPTRSGPILAGVTRTPLNLGEPATAVFSPTAVSVYLEEPHGSPRNVFGVTVVELEPRDDQVRVRATTGSGESLTADVTAAAVGDLDLYPGRAAFYTVKATAVTLYPS